jgi:hypothetical protein
MPHYVIVCPDGWVRHPSYVNREDAACDARLYTEQNNCGTPPWRTPGPCPGGTHRVHVGKTPVDPSQYAPRPS